MGIVGGALLGLPVGPTGAICASYALRGELRAALLGAAGSALALSAWGALAVLGIDATEDWLPARTTLSWLSGAVLLGVATFVWRGADRPQAPRQQTAGPLLLCAGVVISNPAGLALFVLLFAGPLPPGPAAIQVTAPTLALGVALGTWLAFLGPMWLLHRSRARFTERTRVGMVRVLAGGIFLFGAAAVLRAAITG